MSSKIKKILSLIYRITIPIFNPISIIHFPIDYLKYIIDLIKFQSRSSKKINFLDLHPIINQNRTNTEIDYHYFYQSYWLTTNIFNKRPKSHIDVGSQLSIIPLLVNITDLTSVDIRPINININNFKYIKGDITKLPFSSESIESISSLHVIEHIGLGRYGDRLDPSGCYKALKELQRVLKKGGHLYISIPSGIPRICFNAHRVFSTKDILNHLSDLKLLEFKGITDDNNITSNFSTIDKSIYGLGMYHFTK